MECAGIGGRYTSLLFSMYVYSANISLQYPALYLRPVCVMVGSAPSGDLGGILGGCDPGGECGGVRLGGWMLAENLSRVASHVHK